MMKQHLIWNSKWLLFSLPLLMMLSLVALTQTAIFQMQAATLSNAIVLDLLITVPLVYFLIIRKRDVPKITVLSLFVVGIIVASLVIPMEHQFLLSQIKAIALPLAEFGILSFVGLKVYQTVRAYRAQDNTTADFYTAVTKACKEALPSPLNKAAATEIAMVYYALFAPRKRPLQAHEFSYHIKSGTPALLSAFMFIILVEVFVLHILVQQWSPLAAWILTALSVYSCLQVFALVRAIKQRPIVLDTAKQALVLRFGFFSETTISIGAIKSVELSTGMLPEDKSIISLSPIGALTPHNVVVHLKEAATLQQLYGMEKTYKALAFYVDDKERFTKQLKELL